MSSTSPIIGTTAVDLDLDEIVPYWRNPRRIDEDAVNALADSIERYGYQVPIIVDAKNVIISGHARYLALRRLGWKHAVVLVSDLDEKRAKEFRVIDNRVAENSSWNKDALLLELREFVDAEAIALHFPEIDLGLDEFAGSDVTVTEDEVDAAARGLEEIVSSTPSTRTGVRCPECAHEFEVLL